MLKNFEIVERQIDLINNHLNNIQSDYQSETIKNQDTLHQGLTEIEDIL